jgi:hypothetical protein
MEICYENVNILQKTSLFNQCICFLHLWAALKLEINNENGVIFSLQILINVSKLHFHEKYGGLNDKIVGNISSFIQITWNLIWINSKHLKISKYIKIIDE